MQFGNGLNMTFPHCAIDRTQLYHYNSPDIFLNGSTRLSGLAVPGPSNFIKVSFASDFDNKIPSTVESGFEA